MYLLICHLNILVEHCYRQCSVCMLLIYYNYNINKYYYEYEYNFTYELNLNFFYMIEWSSFFFFKIVLS